MSPLDEIAKELAAQAAFLKRREPVYDRALSMFAEALRGEFGERLLRIWDNREFHASYERPLMLLAALRFDALSEGSTHPLYAAVAADPIDEAALTADAFASAIAPGRSRFERALAERFVQTNETTRAVTWLWPAHLLALAGDRRHLSLVDLGASAGLNLIGDKLPALWVDEADRHIPIEPRLPVSSRLGLDIAPLDISSPENATWLRACVWPSDQARLARLDDAMVQFRAAIGKPGAPVLEACSLIDAPHRLASLPHDAFVLCTQTIVRDYLSAEARGRYEEGMRAFLMSRPSRSTIVAELELDLGDSQPTRGAVLLVRFAEHGVLRECELARTHPHPHQLYRNTHAVEAFVAAFRPQPGA